MRLPRGGTDSAWHRLETLVGLSSGDEVAIDGLSLSRPQANTRRHGLANENVNLSEAELGRRREAVVDAIRWAWKVGNENINLFPLRWARM